MSAVGRPRVRNYSFEEVEALVEGYEELNRDRWLVRLMDIERAVKQLPPLYYRAVLLVGILGLPTRYVADYYNISHMIVWVRYRRGLKEITRFLNGY